MYNVQFIVVEVGHTIEKNTLNHIYNVLKLSVHSFLLTIKTAFPCVHGFMLVVNKTANFLELDKINKFKVIFDIHHRITAKFILSCYQLRKESLYRI